MFIVFEGVDGAGKSTQLEFFMQALQAKHPTQPIYLTREPGGTAIGEKIRTLILHESMDVETEMLLLYAARQAHIKEVIAPKLAQGIWVVSDRFYYSTYAYQGIAKQGNLDLLASLQQHVVPKNCLPDLLIILDVDVATAKQRCASHVADKFESQAEAFHKAVRLGYQTIAKNIMNTPNHTTQVAVIDASQPIAAVQASLHQLIASI